MQLSEASKTHITKTLKELFKDHALQREIVEVVLSDSWASITGRTLDSLTAEVKKKYRAECTTDTVRAAAAHARKTLADSGFVIKIDGYSYSFALEKRNYRLAIKTAADPQKDLRQFWAPYLSQSDPVIVGVLARLFFRAESRRDGGRDEVYIRSKLVNRGEEVEYSAILAGVLRDKKLLTAEYRQYMSSGDVEAAFILLELFLSLECRARGVRIPGGGDLMNSSRILLGSGKQDGVPTSRPNQEFLYEESHDGIRLRSESKAIPDFEDSWNELIIMSCSVGGLMPVGASLRQFIQTARRRFMGS